MGGIFKQNSSNTNMQKTVHIISKLDKIKLQVSRIRFTPFCRLCCLLPIRISNTYPMPCIVKIRIPIFEHQATTRWVGSISIKLIQKFECGLDYTTQIIKEQKSNFLPLVHVSFGQGGEEKVREFSRSENSNFPSLISSVKNSVTLKTKGGKNLNLDYKCHTLNHSNFPCVTHTKIRPFCFSLGD